MGGIFGKSGMHAGLLTKAGAMKKLKSTAIETNPALREQINKDKITHGKNNRGRVLQDVDKTNRPRILASRSRRGGRSLLKDKEG
jgi:hypothetical protein